VQVKEVVAEMQKYGLNQNKVCDDLGFNKGDLSSYLSEKKSLPKSRAKAFYWYFKFKELSNGGGNNR
jgi:predicted transcriptional regulator